MLIFFTTLISCNFKNSSEKNKDKYLESLKSKESETINKPKDDLGELIGTIEFQVKANKEELKDFEDGFIPWISIENPEAEINNLIDAEKIVIKSDEININIDYPLNNPVNFNFKSSKNGFTRKQLILEISKKYNEIYNEEEKSAKVKTIPIDKREGLINRNQTDGKYGIWGHDIGDLDLSTIEIYKTKEGKINIVLGIES